MKRDYYEVLGIERNASAADVKAAFRKLARQWHPDRHKELNKKDAEEKFKEIAEAYEVLSDDEKRRRYDVGGHQAVNDVGSHFSGVSVEDIIGSFFGGNSPFGDMFGDMFGGSGSGRRRGPQPGPSLKAQVSITLEEAFAGVQKTIEINRHKTCESCNGTGATPGTSPATCPTCGGRGVVISSGGFFRMQTTCPRCNGSGTIITNPCVVCQGAGISPETKRIEFFIPAGIHEDTRIRLEGEGEPGEKGAPRGDLYVFVQIKKHKFFVRREDDILVEVPVSFPKAALGGSIKVPSLGGGASLDIPAGVQPGDVFRIKGAGMPNLQSKGKVGDQIVHITVEVPKKLTADQKELLVKFAETTGEPDIDEYNRKKNHKGLFERVADFFSE